MEFSPQAQGDEAGISVFLTQVPVLLSEDIPDLLTPPEPPR